MSRRFALVPTVRGLFGWLPLVFLTVWWVRWPRMLEAYPPGVGWEERNAHDLTAAVEFGSAVLICVLASVAVQILLRAMRLPSASPAPAPAASARQAWLDALVVKLRPELEKRIGRTVPPWPVVYDASMMGVRGMAAYPGSTLGGPRILIAPAPDAMSAASTLAHEWLHGALDPGAGHGMAFQDLEERAGFQGLSTPGVSYGGREAGQAFTEWARPILNSLPQWPTDARGAPPHPDEGAADAQRWAVSKAGTQAFALCLAVGLFSLPWLASIGPMDLDRRQQLADMLPIGVPVCVGLAALIALAAAGKRRSDLAPVCPSAFLQGGVVIATPPFLMRAHFAQPYEFLADNRFVEQKLKPGEPADVGRVLYLIEAAALYARSQRGDLSGDQHIGGYSARLLPEHGFVVDEYTRGGDRVALVAFAVKSRLPMKEQAPAQRAIRMQRTIYEPSLREVRLGAAEPNRADAGAARFRNAWAEGA